MACTALTKGRGIDCNRISGGVKFIYFWVLDDAATYAYDVTNALEIDTIDFNGATIFRYTMPLGVSSVTDTIVGSRENGTIYYTPTAQVLYNRLTVQDQEEIKLLGATKVRIFAQLNQQVVATGNDVILALGMVNGMELNAGTMDTGAAWGDKNGYTLTFDGMEQQPMAMLEDYTTIPFDNAGFTNEAAIFPTIS
tara:strand:+ start:4853 stop:5437 length:585 start_codon:yes stop_codon:yes gene_type:complete